MGQGLCIETGSSMTIFDWLDHVTGTYGASVGLKSFYDDDFIDRISHYYSAIIVTIFTVIVSTCQYVGTPIDCFVPWSFFGSDDENENRRQYTNFVCWMSNTYYVPFNKQIPVDYGRREEKEIVYYQYVPMILLCTVMFFKFPRMVWKVLSASSGVSVDRIVYIARESMAAAPEEREKRLRHIVKYMDEWLENAGKNRAGMCIGLRKIIARYCCILCGKHYGNYIITVVLFVKVLYLTNAISLLFVLNLFLGTEYHLYGLEILHSVMKGEDWYTSHRFPRVTLCDFEIRQMINVQRWTVQCVLPINLFNEKIFIFLWFWLVFVAIATAFGLLTKCYSVVFPQYRNSYVRKYLKLTNQYKKTEKDRKIIRRFINTYLQQDGVFVLRAISNNANDVICSELVKYLYKNYKEKMTHVDEKMPV